MRHRALVVLMAGAVAAGTLLHGPATAAAPRRILVVLVVEPLDQWARTPALRPLLEIAAFGTLQRIPASRGRAIDVLGSGEPQGRNPTRLAEVLADQGIPFVARAPAGRELGAGNIRVDLRAAVPGDLATPSLAVLDGAHLVPKARTLLQRDDVLIVLGMPPGETTGVIAAYGAGGRGALSSLRTGAVWLVDVAPSILAILELPQPRSMTGRPFRIEPAKDPVAALREGGSRSPVPALLIAGVLTLWFISRRRRTA